MPALAGPVRPVHWIMLDFGAALILLVLTAGHAAGQAHRAGVPPWLLAVAGGVTALPVAARRYQPAGMFCVALAVSTLFIVIGGSGAPAVAVEAGAMTEPGIASPARERLKLRSPFRLTMPGPAGSLSPAMMPPGRGIRPR